MGSYIGDYVHYRFKNYRSYGIGTKDKPQKANANTIFQQHKQQIQQIALSQAKAINTVALEKQLNRYYDINKDLQTGIINKDTQILKELQNQLQAQLMQKYGNIKIDWNTLSASMADFSFGQAVVQANQQLEQNMNRYKNNLLKVSGDGSVNAKSVRNRIMALRELQNTLLLQGNVQEANALGNKLDQIRNQYNSIVGSLGGNRINVSKNLGLITELNEIFTQWKRKNSTKLMGDLAEMLVLTLGDVMKCVGTSAVAGVVSKLLNDITKNQGTNTFSKGLAINLYAPGVRTGQWTETQNGVTSRKSVVINDPKTGLRISVEPGGHGSRQGKVDVRLSFADGVNASVKNYSSKSKFADKGIKIHSGSSLLFFAQQYPEFLNHYMNIMAAHPDENASGAEITTAKEAMKMTILLHSLKGGFITSTGIMNTNDVLIVNDNSTGRMRVFHMHKIINNIANNLDMLMLNPDLENNLMNDYVEVKGMGNSMFGANVRIEKILAQLHSAKVNASISHNALF